MYRSKASNYGRFFGVVFCCIVFSLSQLTFGVASSKADKTISLNTADSSPYSTPDDVGLYDKILLRVFELVGVNITINHLPSARSIENVDLGIDDGEYARIKGLTKKYANILIVDEKLLDFAFTAFSKNADIKLKNWNSLRDYNVAYIRGWKIYEKNVTGTRSVQVSSSEDELFKLLLSDRVDIVLYEQLRGIDYMKRNNIYGIHPLREPLSVRGMYLYFNKEHEAVIPKIEKALKTLKSTGEYSDIVKSFLE